MRTFPIEVVLVDEHRCFVELLADRINSEPDLRVVGTAASAENGLRSILETKPDIALFDVELPGRGSFDCVNDLARKQPKTKIVFLTGYLSDVFLEQALRLKTHGYLMKREPVDVVIESIRQVSEGGFCFSREVEEKIQYDPDSGSYKVRSASRLSSLTYRQLEVLRHLAKGDRVKQIAKTLHLSHRSVDSQKYRIMQKLGIHDRVHLARVAIREGLMLP